MATAGGYSSRGGHGRHDPPNQFVALAFAVFAVQQPFSEGRVAKKQCKENIAGVLRSSLWGGGHWTPPPLGWTPRRKKRARMTPPPPK